MRLRKLKRLLKPESLEGELTEQDRLAPAREAVEQSKLALEQAEQTSAEALAIAARARKIGQRNGFGQLAEKLFEQERERRRHISGHGHTA